MSGLRGILEKFPRRLSTARRLVGVGRFELPTSRSRTVRSSLTELHPAKPPPTREIDGSLF
jgi:hypothetical protein